MMQSNTERDRSYSPAADNGAFGPDAFRSVMRHLAGAVCIISTSGASGKHGLTASAICSVCADPPTILVIVNRTSRTHPHIRSNGTFSVNILSERQADVAKLLSSKSDNQFAEVAHIDTDDGAILIEGTLAHFHCRVIDEHEVGTHTIFIGRILTGQTGTGAPLLYYNASFSALRSL
ncbi:MAG TPA: flavin reductase family protein [Dongiaceae bacterium]|jgi:flavin reductase (DIM6/NTAB) family NADH-FMN oxidoreductase RutF|nr:flavin reductase family protein [Dongiaceae bacterium]